MTNDLWSEKEYQYILDHVKKYLWLYVLPNASIKELQNAVQNLTKLENREIDLLATVHFLLSNEVKTFVETVPRILRRLSHSSQKEIVKSRGVVRGKIDWNLTIKERCAQGYDQTIFVCMPPSRIFNLPENQLLKFVLTQIKRLIEETAHLPRVEEKNIRAEELKIWIDRLSWLKFHVNNALKHTHLKGVDLPKQVSERMIRRSRTARNKDYELVADSYSLHRQIMQELDIEVLEQLIEKRILEPLERDTLYELFVLFEVIDSMNKIGKLKELNLIRSGAELIGTFKVRGQTVRVYFQRIKGLLERSKYKQIFEDYDLDVSLRRPDIILHVEEQNKLLIIEVKRTKDKKYIVDSVYKVLGYIADFEEHFAQKQKLRGVLVVWSNIKRLRKTEQAIAILAHNEIRDFIKETI